MTRKKTPLMEYPEPFVHPLLKEETEKRETFLQAMKDEIELLISLYRFQGKKAGNSFEKIVWAKMINSHQRILDRWEKGTEFQLVDGKVTKTEK